MQLTVIGAEYLVSPLVEGVVVVVVVVVYALALDSDSPRYMCGVDYPATA